METRGFNTVPGTFIIINHLLVLTLVPIYLWYGSPSALLWALSGIMVFITGLSITGGYHRYFSHKTYKTYPMVETVILFLSSMAAQGSALRWSCDHRQHHAYTDTDLDPYSINKGFWFAHILWIFRKPLPIDAKVVPDLLRNPRVMFQHNHYALCVTLSIILCALGIGFLTGDYIGAFVIGSVLRIFTLHHFTWFINSAAHTWGDKPFCQEQSAVNNYILSFLTFGEGYHNYHHTFANDYRNGIRWYHFDPTKWLIWTLNKLGLAHSLKQVDPVTIQKRMVLQRKDLLLDRLKELFVSQREDLERQILELSEAVLNQIAALHQLNQRYKEWKREQKPKEVLAELITELRLQKRNLKNSWHQWMQLSHEVLQLKAV